MKNDSLAIFAFRGTYWTEWPFTQKSIKKINIKYLQNVHEPTRLRTKMKTTNSGDQSGAAIFRRTSHAKLPFANVRAMAGLKKKSS